MEISLEIANRALKKASQSTASNSELDSIIDNFDYNNLDAIINSERDQSIHFRLTEIMQGAIVHANYSNNDTELIAVLGTAKKILSKAIKTKDLKSLFQFLHLNLYLKFRVGLLLTSIITEAADVDSLADKIIQTFNSFQINLSIQDGAPEYEIEAKVVGDEAFKNSNIARYYSFIDSVEMSQGFRVNPLLLSLFSFLADLKFASVQELIHGFKSHAYCLLYFPSLSFDQLHKISTHRSMSDKWSVFESLRQISKKRRPVLQNEELINVSEIISKLETLDSTFYMQAIAYFNNNANFNGALGYHLAIGDAAQLQAIVDVMPITQYDTNKIAKQQLLQSYKAATSYDNYGKLVEHVYLKWKRFLNNSISNPEFHALAIIETDYFEYVCEYFKMKNATESLDMQIKQLLTNIVRIDIEWFSSSSSQRTKFFIYFSELFAISCTYSNVTKEPPVFSEEYEQFKAQGTLKHRFFGDKDYYYNELIKNLRPS